MKIYDPSISRREAITLKDALERVRDEFPKPKATVTKQTPGIVTIVVGGGKDKGQNDDHTMCRIGTLREFTSVLDLYANGQYMRDAVRNKNNSIVKEFFNDELVARVGKDLFMIGEDGYVLAIADSEEAKANARATAWHDIGILADIFSQVVVKNACNGHRNAVEDIALAIRNNRREALVLSVELTPGRDYEPIVG